MLRQNISVIVPTYNGAKKLPNLLAALEKQTNRNFEVIIVSDGSKDNTEEILQNGKWTLDIHFIQQENQGRSATRNNGAASARNEILLFFDDDMRPMPDCVEQHYLHHTQYPGSIVTGGLTEEVKGDSSELFKYKSFLSDKWLEPFKSWDSKILSRDQIFITTANFSIPKKIFEQLSGFDNRLNDAEDYEFAVRAYKATIPMYYRYKAFAWHDDSITVVSYIKRQRQYVNAQEILRNIHPNWIKEGFLKLPYQPTGMKARIFKHFAAKKWISKFEERKLKWIPQSLRYRIYDYIITSNGVFFPENVPLN